MLGDSMTRREAAWLGVAHLLVVVGYLVMWR